MINSTQVFLLANNKPPAKSFYDQMVSNKEKDEKAKKKEADELERLQTLEEDKEVSLSLSTIMR